MLLRVYILNIYIEEEEDKSAVVVHYSLSRIFLYRNNYISVYVYNAKCS